tara:strand:+ start:1287 stop:1982 length:696 start_codon:yes stop_codon:yes gene_type:complete
VRAGLVLSCEHATFALPPGLDLGLGPEVLASHHGWDAGALDLARALAGTQRAPLIEAEVSRLVIDLNRSAAKAVPQENFGLPIPGNLHLRPEEIERRLERYHRPYRAAVRDAARAQAPCLHLSLHSFAKVLEGRTREVEVGVLFDPARPAEARASEGLLRALRTQGWDARPNDPYLGIDDGLTTWLRPQLPDGSYAGIEIELSQSLDPARRADLARDLDAALSQVRKDWPG